MFLHGYRESISNQCATEKGFAMDISGVNNNRQDIQLDQLKRVQLSVHNVNVFPADNPTSANQKGISVERNGQNPPTEPPTQTTTVSFNTLVKQMGLTDNTLIAQLETEFNGLLDKDGNIVGDANKLQSSIQEKINKFVEAHQENFTVQNSGKNITFTANSSKELIDKLEQDKVIEANNDNTYRVLNEKSLNQTLTKQIETKYEPAEERQSISVGASTTTVTKTKDNPVTIPENLRENKAGRKKLEADARAQYEKMAKDPAKADAIAIYVAENKYAKDIEKMEKELLHDKNSTISRNRTRNDADIVMMYIGNYAGEEEKEVFSQLADNLILSKDKDDQDAMLEAFNTDLNSGIKKTSFNDLSDAEKANAAVICLSKANGYQPKDLLHLMAINEVMKTKDPEKVKKYFVEHQAEDYVKNQQAQQDIPNTVLHLTRSGKRHANEDDGKIHTEVGKGGRRMVSKCAAAFGDEITKAQFDAAKDKDNYYSASVKNLRTGKYETKYYEFNKENFQLVMKVACDPNNASEADKAKLKNLNMTLEEGRDGIMSLRLTDNDGRMSTVEEIIGNGNRKVGNKELNRWRHMAEAAGYSVDANHTVGKRILHVLKDAVIGTGVGIATGGLSGLFGGAVKYAGETASQVVSYNGKTGDRLIDYSGRTADRNVTVNTHINDEFGGYDINQSVNVPGQDYNGTVLADGQNYSGEVEAKGQKFNGKTNNIRSQMRNAGILGGIAGTIAGLTSMNGVNDKGRANDDVFDFSTEKEDVEQGTNLSLNIPKFKSVETREGTMTVEETAGFKPCKLVVKRFNANTNRAETMESMIEKYYNVKRGSEDYNKIYNYVKDFNELQKFGGMQYPLHNIVNLPDWIPESVTGKKVERVADPSDPNKKLQLDTQDIHLRRGANVPRPGAAGHKSQIIHSYYAKGTIR